MAFSNDQVEKTNSVSKYKERLLNFIENYNKNFLNGYLNVGEILSIYKSVLKIQQEDNNNVRPVAEDGYVFLSFKP